MYSPLLKACIKDSLDLGAAALIIRQLITIETFGKTLDKSLSH